jgi:hypothetical protein
MNRRPRGNTGATMARYRVAPEHKFLLKNSKLSAQGAVVMSCICGESFTHEFSGIAFEMVMAHVAAKAVR